MSPEDNAADKLKGLPGMTEEHLAVLRKHGLTTPERLLEAINNAPKWKAIHAELKGVGPKTVEKWKSMIESGQSKPAEKPATPEKAPEAPKPQVVKVARQIKKPAEAKAPPAAVPKPEPAVKKEEPAKEPAPIIEKAPEKVAEKPKAAEPVKPKAEKRVTEKRKAEPKAKAKEKTEEKAEEKEALEVVEEGEYVPNKKPKLSPEVKDALRKRAKISENRPEFLRQEYGRRLRLRATGWRKPRGIHSKARYKMRYRPPMVSIGYAGPKLTKGYHPSGFREVHVFNVADLTKISDADQQAARIAHGVGQRKREQIIKKADELGIRVLNRS